MAPHLRHKPSSLPDGPTQLTEKSANEATPPERSSRLPVLGAVALGVAAVAGVVKMNAQNPPTSISIQQEDSFEQGFTTLSDTTDTKKPKAATSVSIDQTNDSMREWMRGTLNGNDKVPGSDYADDDGWTSELRLDITRTQGDEQWVLGARHAMLTQQGAWLPSPDYEGLRTDLGELVLQKNVRTDLNDRAQLTYGIGGGLQASGPLGGHALQEWFHYNGGFGGRVGDDLQSNYSTSGIDVAPILTGGAGMTYRLTDNDLLSATGRVQGTLPLGPGHGSLRSEVGLRLQPHSRVSLEGGFKLDAAYADAPAFDFYDTDGVHPGYYGQLNVDAFKHFKLFGRIQDGGFRNEPVFSIGFTIGGGNRPWLDPVGR